MRLGPERDALPRLLAFVYLAIAAAGLAVCRLWGPALERLAYCPLRRGTGLPCPTCGGTHAALHLARGQLAAAWRENPLVVLAAAGLAAWVAYAAAATLVPAWRREIALTPAGRRLAGAAVLAVVLGTWLYEIVRLG